MWMAATKGAGRRKQGAKRGRKQALGDKALEQVSSSEKGAVGGAAVSAKT